MKKYIVILSFALCLLTMDNQASELTIYDLIPQSIKQSKGNLDRDFHDCLVSVMVSKDLAQEGKRVNAKNTAPAQEKAVAIIDEIPWDEYLQKLEDWLLIRNWYEKQHSNK